MYRQIGLAMACRCVRRKVLLFVCRVGVAVQAERPMTLITREEGSRAESGEWSKLDAAGGRGRRGVWSGSLRSRLWLSGIHTA